MTRQFAKRLDKVAAQISPSSDGTFTLEEFNRAIWREDPNGFREFAKQRYPELLSLIPGFEAEDAHRRPLGQLPSTWAGQGPCVVECVFAKQTLTACLIERYQACDQCS